MGQYAYGMLRLPLVSKKVLIKPQQNEGLMAETCDHCYSEAKEKDVHLGDRMFRLS